MTLPRSARRTASRRSAWTLGAVLAASVLGAPAASADSEDDREDAVCVCPDETGRTASESGSDEDGADEDGERLSWAPPELDDPITITLSTKERSPKLKKGQDYIIEAPETIKGRVTIKGGDDVVWIGGRIEAPDAKRALYLNGSTGVVHVEGVHIAGKKLKEGINISSADAEVRLQNVLIDTVDGSKKGHHADLVQTWKGPRKLLIDRLEGTTTYQAFMWDPYDFGKKGSVDLYEVRNSVLRHTGKGGIPIYKAKGDYEIRTSDVVIVSPKGRPVDRLIHSGDAPKSAFEGVTTAKRADSPLLGKPGKDYESPGYAEGGDSDEDADEA